MRKLTSILRAFNIHAADPLVRRIPEGNINDTYWVSTTRPPNAAQYLLQRINHHVFKDPARLMENIISVTDFLREKIREEGGEAERETLNFLPANNGSCLHVHPDGTYWRACIYVEGTSTYQVVENPRHFGSAGEAFGRFLRLLEDYPAHTLHETIPDFHNTPMRLEAFEKSIERDIAERAAGAEKEIDFIMERAPEVSIVEDLIQSGRLPLRVTHNDTKFNNVLIDNKTGEGVCVIDLDTVMPGTVLYDYGDAIRSGANTGGEETEDLSEVELDLDLFRHYTAGYMNQASGTLLEIETEHLAFSTRLMTLELAIRFLTDHLDGDIYFKTEKPSHNLLRARTQIKLLQDIENKYERMLEIISARPGTVRVPEHTPNP